MLLSIITSRVLEHSLCFIWPIFVKNESSVLGHVIRLKVIDQQAEVKSDASMDAAGSKVVVNFGCGEHRLTVEATPDFYVRKQAPIVYLMIGEVGSKGLKDLRCSWPSATLACLLRGKLQKLVLSS